MDNGVYNTIEIAVNVPISWLGFDDFRKALKEVLRDFNDQGTYVNINVNCIDSVSGPSIHKETIKEFVKNALKG